MTIDDDLEDLYGVAPTDFLARRKDLVAAAKKRGDAEAAATIGGARRPTTAAWVVNALVRADPTATARLSELSESLHEAHAAMAGPRIRELSTAQRKLIDELARTGFAATGQSSPSAALRDDVVGTLQAAVADPGVAARLGRLEKAEQWSGFGDFGAVTAVGPAAKPKAKSEPASAEPEVAEADIAAARERASSARAEAEAAQRAHAEAVDAAADREAKLAKARRHYEKLLASVDAAEKALNAADDAFTTAERAAREAAERLAGVRSEADRAEAELGALAERRSP